MTKRYTLQELLEATRQTSDDLGHLLKDFMPTGSVFYNGEGNDLDIVAVTRTNLTLSSRALTDAGWDTCGGPGYANRDDTWEAFRKGAVNLIVVEDLKLWKESRDLCTMLAVVSPITKQQRAIVHWFLRDEMRSLQTARKYVATMGSDYV